MNTRGIAGKAVLGLDGISRARAGSKAGERRQKRIEARQDKE